MAYPGPQGGFPPQVPAAAMQPPGIPFGVAGQANGPPGPPLMPRPPGAMPLPPGGQYPQYPPPQQPYPQPQQQQAPGPYPAGAMPPGGPPQPGGVRPPGGQPPPRMMPRPPGGPPQFPGGMMPGMPPPGGLPPPPPMGGPPGAYAMQQGMQQMSMGGPPPMPPVGMGMAMPMGNIPRPPLMQPAYPGAAVGPMVGPPRPLGPQPVAMAPPPTMGAPPMGTGLGAPPGFVPAPPNAPKAPGADGAPGPMMSMGHVGHMSGGGGVPMGGAGGPGGPRIDPDQIPRPVPARMTEPLQFETRSNGSANAPPPSTSSFVVSDFGNCSPRFMRCSLTSVPQTAEVASTCAMPLLLALQPLALQEAGEEPVQLVDLGEMGPPRCGRCKAYMNPGMRFLEGGRKFQCNLCGQLNDCPRDYVCNLGADGRRRDWADRPELCRGTVEFAAPSEYMVRPPMAPTYFFLVDVSYGAVTSGATAAACAAASRTLAALADLPWAGRVQVALATFDAAVNFFNLRSPGGAPQMLVVPDVTDVYAPLPRDLVAPLSEARERVERLLEAIPPMVAGTRVSDCAALAAVKGALAALKTTGGRVVLLLASLPSAGLGNLKSRELEGRAAKGGGDAEREPQKLLAPADSACKKLGLEAADAQVCVDVYLLSSGHVDVATLGVLAATTGGQLYHYPAFDAPRDGPNLAEDLRWNVSRPQGLEAVMRVRCSQGLSVSDYGGHFAKRTPTDVDLPAVDCDKAITVVLRHDDKLTEGAEACLQCALLYTTVDGYRRIRVHTLSLPVTPVLGTVFRGADLDTQFTHLLRGTAASLAACSLVAAREAALASCVAVLFAYRKFCASSSSSGQLILPEALKLLPLYTLALHKTLLAAGMRPDDRAALAGRAAWLPPAAAMALVHPRLFEVHRLLEGPPTDPSGGGPLPPTLTLSSEKLDADGVFLMDNGLDAYLWVGKLAPPELTLSLLGVPSADHLQGPSAALVEPTTPIAHRLQALLSALRAQRKSALRLRVLRRGDPAEALFLNSLVEDRLPSGMSYVEFLCHVHRQIQNKFT